MLQFFLVNCWDRLINCDKKKYWKKLRSLIYCLKVGLMYCVSKGGIYLFRVSWGFLSLCNFDLYFSFLPNCSLGLLDKKSSYTRVSYTLSIHIYSLFHILYALIFEIIFLKQDLNHMIMYILCV